MTLLLGIEHFYKKILAQKKIQSFASNINHLVQYLGVPIVFAMLIFETLRPPKSIEVLDDTFKPFIDA